MKRVDLDASAQLADTNAQFSKLLHDLRIQARTLSRLICIAAPRPSGKDTPMEIYDTTRGVSFDTRPILMFAKIQVEGLGTGLDRDDWMVAIEQRCEERYGAIDKLSPEQRFTKTITEDNL